MCSDCFLKAVIQKEVSASKVPPNWQALRTATLSSERCAKSCQWCWRWGFTSWTCRLAPGTHAEWFCSPTPCLVNSVSPFLDFCRWTKSIKMKNHLSMWAKQICFQRIHARFQGLSILLKEIIKWNLCLGKRTSKAWHDLTWNNSGKGEGPGIGVSWFWKGLCFHLPPPLLWIGLIPIQVISASIKKKNLGVFGWIHESIYGRRSGQHSQSSAIFRRLGLIC